MSSKETALVNENNIIDGDFFAGWNYPSAVTSRTCAATKNEIEPFVKILMTSSVSVSTLYIVGRNDQTPTELSKSFIWISDNLSTQKYLCPQAITGSGFYDCQLKGSQIMIAHSSTSRMTLCEVRIYSGINILQKSVVSDCSGLISGQLLLSCISVQLKGYPIYFDYSSTGFEGGPNRSSSYGLQKDNSSIYGGWIIFQLPETRTVSTVVIVGNQQNGQQDYGYSYVVAVIETGFAPKNPQPQHYCDNSAIQEPPHVTLNSDGLGFTNELVCNKSGQYVLIRKVQAKELILHGVAILQDSTSPGTSNCFNFKFYGPTELSKEVQLWDEKIYVLIQQTDVPSLKCSITSSLTGAPDSITFEAPYLVIDPTVQRAVGRATYSDIRWYAANPNGMSTPDYSIRITISFICKAQTITAPSPVGDQIYVIRSNSAESPRQILIPNYVISPDMCPDDTSVQTLTWINKPSGTTSTLPTFLQFPFPRTQKILVYTDKTTDIGTYEFSLMATPLSNSLVVSPSLQTFKLTIVNCPMSLTVSTSSLLNHVRGQSVKSDLTLNNNVINDINCGAEYYEATWIKSSTDIAALPSFMTLTSRSLFSTATDQSQVTTYTIRVRVYGTSLNPNTDFKDITITVKDCILTQLVNGQKFANYPDKEPSLFYLIGTTMTLIIQPFVQVPLCGYNVTYNIATKQLSQSMPSWIKLENNSQVVIKSTDNTLVLTQNLVLSGYVSNYAYIASQDTLPFNTSFTFYVTPIDCRITITSTGTSLITEVYSAPVTVTFSYSVLFPNSCGAIKDSVLLSDGSPLPSFIKWNSSGKTLTMEATQPTHVGTYNANIYYYISDYPEVKSAVIMVTCVSDPCKVVSFVEASPISNLEYVITDLVKYIAIPAFNQTPTYCGYQYTIAYSMQESSATLPSFATFQATQQQIVVYGGLSMMPAAGVYMVKITATLNDASKTKRDVPFTITGYDCRRSKQFTPQTLNLTILGSPGVSNISERSVAEYCGTSYVSDVKMSTGDALPTFIVLDNIAQKITITPMLESQISTYAIQYTIKNTQYDAISTLSTLNVYITKCRILSYTATSSNFSLSYVMGFPKSNNPIPEITQSPTCGFTNTYSFQNTELGSQLPTFTVMNVDTRMISLYSSGANYNEIGTYNLKVVVTADKSGQGDIPESKLEIFFAITSIDCRVAVIFNPTQLSTSRLLATPQGVTYQFETANSLCGVVPDDYDQIWQLISTDPVPSWINLNQVNRSLLPQATLNTSLGQYTVQAILRHKKNSLIQKISNFIITVTPCEITNYQATELTVLNLIQLQSQQVFVQPSLVQIPACQYFESITLIDTNTGLEPVFCKIPELFVYQTQCMAIESTTPGAYNLKYIYSLNDAAQTKKEIIRVANIFDCRAYFPATGLQTTLTISVKGGAQSIQIIFQNKNGQKWSDPWQCGQFISSAYMVDLSEMPSFITFEAPTVPNQRGLLQAITENDADIKTYRVRIKTQHRTITTIYQEKDFIIQVTKCIITQYSTNIQFTASPIVKLQTAFTVTQPVFTQKPLCGYTETVTVTDNDTELLPTYASIDPKSQYLTTLSAAEAIVPGNYRLKYQYQLNDKDVNPTITYAYRDIQVVDCRAYIILDKVSVTTTVKGDPGYMIIDFKDYLQKTWTDPLATLVADPLKKCGIYTETYKMKTGENLPSIIKTEVTTVSNQIRLRVLTTLDSDISKLVVVVTTRSSNFPNSFVSKEIAIEITACVVLKYQPTDIIQDINYLFDSPVTSIRIPGMQQTPDCGYTVTYKLIEYSQVDKPTIVETNTNNGGGTTTTTTTSSNRLRRMSGLNISFPNYPLPTPVVDAPKFVQYEYIDWVMYRTVEKNGIKKNETYTEKQHRILVQTSLIDNASYRWYAVYCSLQQQKETVTLQPFNVLVLSIQIGEIDKDAKLNYVLASRNTTIAYTGTKLAPKDPTYAGALEYKVLNQVTNKEVQWMSFDVVFNQLTVFSDDPTNIGSYTMQLRLTAKKFPDMKPLVLIFDFQIFSQVNLAPEFSETVNAKHLVEVGQEKQWSYTLPKIIDREGNYPVEFLYEVSDPNVLFYDNNFGFFMISPIPDTLYGKSFKIKIKLKDSVGAVSTETIIEVQVKDKKQDVAVVQKEKISDFGIAIAKDLGNQEKKVVEVLKNVQYPDVQIKALTKKGLLELWFSMDMKINPEITALIQANKSAAPVAACVPLPTNSTETEKKEEKDGRMLPEDDKAAAPAGANSTNTTCPPTTPDQAKRMRLLQTFKLTDHLQIEVIPARDSLPENMGMTWDIIDFKPKVMTVQLRFQKAAYISSGSEVDNLNVRFPFTQFFRNTEDNTFQREIDIVRNIIPQLQIDGGEAAAAAAAAQVGQTITYVVTFTMGFFMSQMASTVEALQVIILIPAMQIQLPALTAIVLTTFTQIAAFDIINMQMIWEWFFTMSPGTPLNPSLEAVGFDTCYFVYNLGSLFLSIIYIFIKMVTAIILRFFRRKSKKVKAVWRWFNEGAFWATPLALYIESYAALVMAVILAIMQPTFSEPGQKIQMYLAYYFAVLTFTGPVFFTWFMYKNFDRFQNELWLEHYEPLIEHLNPQTKAIIIHRIVFFARRLLLSFSLTLTSTLIYQFFIFFVQEIATIITIGMGEPFEEKHHHLQEMVNELIILLSMYHFLCFSPFVPSINARSYIGYSLSALLTIYLLYNLIAVIATNIKEGIKWLQRHMLKRSQIRAIQERKLIRLKLRRGRSSFETWRKFRSEKKQPIVSEDTESVKKKTVKRVNTKKTLKTIQETDEVKEKFDDQTDFTGFLDRNSDTQFEKKRQTYRGGKASELLGESVFTVESRNQNIGLPPLPPKTFKKANTQLRIEEKDQPDLETNDEVFGSELVLPKGNTRVVLKAQTRKKDLFNDDGKLDFYNVNDDGTKYRPKTTRVAFGNQDTKPGQAERSDTQAGASSIEIANEVAKTYRQIRNAGLQEETKDSREIKALDQTIGKSEDEINDFDYNRKRVQAPRQQIKNFYPSLPQRNDSPQRPSIEQDEPQIDFGGQSPNVKAYQDTALVRDLDTSNNNDQTMDEFFYARPVQDEASDFDNYGSSVAPSRTIYGSESQSSKNPQSRAQKRNNRRKRGQEQLYNQLNDSQ